MGKKTMKTSEEKPRHKIPVQKPETSKPNLVCPQKLEMQRQMILSRRVVKIPINFSLIPNDQFCKESYHLLRKMIFSARKNVPETLLGQLVAELRDMFGPSYRSFVSQLLVNIWLKVHLRCLQEDAGGLSDEAMSEMHPLQLLRLLDGVNNTCVASEERATKELVSEFGLGSDNIVTELVEKLVKTFAEVARDDFAKVVHDKAIAHAMTLAVRGISLASQ